MRSASPGSRATSWPKMRIDPRWVANSRVTSEKSVLLPAPLSPSRTVKLAGTIAKLTSASACRRPYAWLTPSTASAGGAVVAARSGVTGSVPCNGHAPWKLADLDRLDHLQRGHVDDAHVVRYAVGSQQVLLVGRECHVPHPLADQQIFDHVVGDGVDHRDPVGRPERDKRLLAVRRDVDAHRLDRLGAQARDREGDLGLHGVLFGIDHAD